jgi:carboxyl-terminal processing protease
MRTRNTNLTFTVNPQFVTWDGRKVAPFAGPVAILVDELTGSASETFAGALQSLGRARVFGRATMGQALPAVTKQLSNGDVLMHAVGDFVTSTGKSLEGPGVIPDVEVPLSRKALAAGRDSALEAALRWIDESAGRGR